jgi:hypothetical protein
MPQPSNLPPVSPPPAVEATRAQAAARADAIAGSPFTGTPEDAQILTGLRARREILGQQLDRVAERRQRLAGELSNTSHAEGAVRSGLEKRLEVLDDQVVQLERDMVATDRLLAGAPPQLLAEAREEPRVVHTGADEGEVLGVSAASFALGMLVLTAARRIRRWRRRNAPGAVEAAAAGAGPDPRIDRLAHAVDAIAVEVERIGEGQRFVTQLLAESRPRLAEYAAAEGAPTQGVPGAGR